MLPLCKDGSLGLVLVTTLPSANQREAHAGTAATVVNVISKVSLCTVQDAFLGTTDVGTAWMKSVLFNNVPVQMKVDTGANITIP